MATGLMSMAGIELTEIFGNTGVYIQLLRFFIVFLIGIGVTRAVFMPIVRKIAAKRDTGKKTKHSLENLIGIFGFFAAFTAALQAGDFGSLVTVIGTVAAAATVAVGWGMRDQVGNLVSGVFLHLYPPFVNGDYVSAGDVSGTVKEVNMGETELRSTNGEKLVVPNSYLTTRPLTNHTKGTITQDSFTAKIRPEKVDAATDILKSIAAEYDEVLNTPQPKVLYSDIDKDGVTTELVYYVEDNKDIQHIRSIVIKEFNTAAVEQELLAAPETEDDEA